MDVRRSSLQSILMAYLELVLTFPLERFQLVSPVLSDGFLQLAKTITDPQLLDRINIFFDKKDITELSYK